MIAPQNIIVAGIGTEIGKTVSSAALVQKLKADYWKPVQAGELEHSDSHKIKALCRSISPKIHPEAYRLKSAMSPHAAAEIDQLSIELDQLKIPETDNHLIIELAGGLMVPLNKKQNSLDWLKAIQLPVVLVSQYYLGQINHTLLSIHALKSNGIPILGVLFNGKVNEASRRVILEQAEVPEIGSLPQMEELSEESIKIAANGIQLERAFSL